MLGYTRLKDATFGGKGDYASFAAAGIPVVCYAWDGDACHHTAGDRLTPEREAQMRKRLPLTARSLLASLLEVHPDLTVTPVGS